MLTNHGCQTNIWILKHLRDWLLWCCHVETTNVLIIMYSLRRVSLQRVNINYLWQQKLSKKLFQCQCKELQYSTSQLPTLLCLRLFQESLTSQLFFPFGFCSFILFLLIILHSLLIHVNFSEEENMKIKQESRQEWWIPIFNNHSASKMENYLLLRIFCPTRDRKIIIQQSHRACIFIIIAFFPFTKL